VIQGELARLTIAHQIGRAVAHGADDQLAPSDHRHHDGRGHGFGLVFAVALGVDHVVGLGDGARQALGRRALFLLVIAADDRADRVLAGEVTAFQAPHPIRQHEDLSQLLQRLRIGRGQVADGVLVLLASLAGVGRHSHGDFERNRRRLAHVIPQSINTLNTNSVSPRRISSFSCSGVAPRISCPLMYTGLVGA